MDLPEDQDWAQEAAVAEHLEEVAEVEAVALAGSSRGLTNPVIMIVRTSSLPLMIKS